MSRDELELADDADEGASEEDIEELDPSEAIDTQQPDADPRSTTDRWRVRTDSGERGLPDSVALDPDAEVTREGTRRVYSALCAMAHVEHRPTPAQRQELLDYQDYLGVSPWVANLIETQARRSPELRVGRRVSELELVMNAMIDMACADGGVSMAEGRLLARVNERARWSREQVGAAIKRSLARQAAAAPASDVQPVEARDAQPEVIELRSIQVAPALRVEPIEVATTHEPDEEHGGVWEVPVEELPEPLDEGAAAREELDKLDELLSCLSRRTEARGVTPEARKTPRRSRKASRAEQPIGLRSVEASSPFEDSADEELVLLSPETAPMRKRA